LTPTDFLPLIDLCASDFVAVLKLVHTVIDALRESSHATTSFHSLIQELCALEYALRCVKRLDPTTGDSADYAALREAACQCQQTMDGFYKKIRKYQPHLQRGGTNSTIRDGWMKIKWASCKDDVENFRAEIRGHTSSIAVLLLMVQAKATDAHRREQKIQYTMMSRMIQFLYLMAMGLLCTMAKNINHGLKQGKALIEAGSKVVEMNMRVFQAVQELRLSILSLPGQVERNEPVYLIDALNILRPFHLEFITSAEALISVLKDNLRSVRSSSALIDQRKYRIEELETLEAIDLSGPWETCFFPGQRVAMSMIFDREGNKWSPTTCPVCQQRQEGSDTTNITW